MISKKLSIKKTNSFRSPNYYSMDHHQQISSSRNCSRSAHHHQVEFPTSPEVPKLGEEIFHETLHPQHPISQTSLLDLFTCAACKEYGAGDRFACTECAYQLHDFCTLAPPVLKRHPIHPLHKIIFSSKPGGILKSGCDICAKPTKGCVFKCTVCSFQMHPCCAMLSTEIIISVHPHTLRLLPAAASGALSPNGGNSATGGTFVCGECNRRRSGRVYNCTICDYHLHAVCAKNMVNGLQANGIKGKDKPSMLGKAARLATQVVKEFIGGIIEGLGEGVGQVLIQTASRGRSTVNISPRTT